MTAAPWIEDWLEECKQKTTRTRICLGEALCGRRRMVGLSMAPSGRMGWAAGALPHRSQSWKKIKGV